VTFFKKEILFGPLCVLINRREVSRMQTETLLRRVQTGDADALDALVREYYPQILNYCRWHVPDAQQAQDAAQETFYKVVRWLDGCGGFAGQFRPFLYKIAKNVCADWHRASARDGPALESLPEEPGYQEAGFDQTEDALSLRALTARLDPETRELVLLRFGQQLKLREIAQVTGLPMRTVQSRLRAALKILKNQLEQEELP
jgi:RNA polymerase sigma factor (sigma-70 family)